MEAMETILTRRSIRRYTPQKISAQLITELLRAAMSAPSAANEQPWHFVVIDDHTVLDEIPKFHPYAAMLPQAPVAIFVCVELIPGREGSVVQDGSAATQNLLLAAHAKGLGAVWLGIYPFKERIQGMRRLTNLPDQMIPLALIALGYPAEEIPRADRYNPQRVHTNRW